MAFYGIPMFGEGLVSKTLDNTIKGRGSSVAQQQLNRGLQQTRRGMMSQAAADRSNPALAVRNAMLAGSQAATDTNMQAAQLRAQEQATALNQRMAQGQQQGQQFFGQLGAIGKGLAASGVLSPDASAAVGAMSGMAPGMVGGQQGGNTSTSGGAPGQASAITSGLMRGATSALAGGMAGSGQVEKPLMAQPGGNTSTPQPVAPATSAQTAVPAPQATTPSPQMDPALAAIYNAASARSGAPAGEMVQVPAQQATADGGGVRDVRGIAAVPIGDGRFRAVARPGAPSSAPQSTAFTDPVIRSDQNEMVFGLPGQTAGQADVMNAPLLSSTPEGMVFGEAQQAQSPAQAVLAGQSGGNTSTPQPYASPMAPVPFGNQTPLTPEQMAESARRIEQDREVRGMVNQATGAVLPSLLDMGPLVPGTEPFARRPKIRPQDQEPGMVYQDPNRMVFSYDPQDAQRMAQQYGAQQGGGAAAPVASSAGNAISQDDIEAYVRMIGGR